MPDIQLKLLKDGYCRVQGDLLCRDKKAYLKAFFVQVAILSNHQNGRDTHVRQVKAFGPRFEATQFQKGQLHFNTPEFAAYSCVR